jgi:hypothetical protein
MNPRVLIAVATGAQTGSAGISMAPSSVRCPWRSPRGSSPSPVGAIISAMRGEHRSWEMAESASLVREG